MHGRPSAEASLAGDDSLHAEQRDTATAESGGRVPGPVSERVRHRDLVSAGAWVVTSFTVFSAANYAFSLALSRLLSVADYGSFGVLSSILLLVGLVATAGFPWMLSTTVARYRGPEHAAVRASALRTSLVGNSLVGALSGIAVASAAHRLIQGHALVPVLAGTAAFFVCANAVWLGLYQGERCFPFYAALRMGDSIVKALLGAGLAAVGFGLEGALGGVIVGAAWVTAWGAVRVRRLHLPLGTPGRRWIDRAVLPTVWWTAVAQLGLGLIMNMDILAVRALSAGTAAGSGAGYYQAASVLARAPVFIGLALLNTVFPFLAGKAGDRDAESRLLRTALRTIALGPMPAAVLLLAAPGPAIGFFFPSSYAPAIPLLGLNAAAALPLLLMSAGVLGLQATRGMRSAALAVAPTALAEAVCLLYLVPRHGAIGAAWSLCAATSLGAVLVWIPASRRWPPRQIAPSPVLGLALLPLGIAALVVPAPARLWPLEAAAGMAGFLLLVWMLRGISAAEAIPLAPAWVRPLLGWLAERESRGG